MRFVRPKLLDVLICLAIIIFIACLGNTGHDWRPYINLMAIKHALDKPTAWHPIMVDDVQGIITNQNWSGYEVVLSGASNDWTVAFSTKKGFGAALWRMLGIAPKAMSGSLSSSNYFYQTVH